MLTISMVYGTMKLYLKMAVSMFVSGGGGVKMTDLSNEGSGSYESGPGYVSGGVFGAGVALMALIAVALFTCFCMNISSWYNTKQQNESCREALLASPQVSPYIYTVDGKEYLDIPSYLGQYGDVDLKTRDYVADFGWFKRDAKDVTLTLSLNDECSVVIHQTHKKYDTKIIKGHERWTIESTSENALEPLIEDLDHDLVTTASVINQIEDFIHENTSNQP